MSNRVLVVDDDPVVRILMQECLSRHGYEVSALENGPQCLEHLSHDRPDVIVLDLIMPGMTGIEVLHRLRDNPATAGVPVVMLSAHTDTAGLLRRAEAQPDSFLQKPFNLQEAVAAVQAATRTEAGPSAHPADAPPKDQG